VSDTSLCHFLIGPAGSGKTTFATKLLALNPNLVHISTDAIRLKLFGDARVQGGWAAIDAEICQQMQLAHAQGRAVIYDATNIKRPWRLAFIQKYVPLYPNWLGWHLQTPLDICLSQNQLRERQVPEEVITGHYQALQTFPPEAAEGFLAIKEAKADPHKIVITLSNLFTTPLATGIPFNWQDITPVAMLALDQFVLWSNTEKPYKTAKEYIDAAKAAGPNKFKMGGTGSKSEDQIITVAMEIRQRKPVNFAVHDDKNQSIVSLLIHVLYFCNKKFIISRINLLNSIFKWLFSSLIALQRARIVMTKVIPKAPTTIQPIATDN
jgi:predicted kinase